MWSKNCVGAPLLKKRLQRRCFPVSFAKFLRTFFSQNTSGGCFCNSTFLIMNSCSKSTAEKQGRVAGGSSETSIFGWFLCGFRWFLLVAGDIRWFEVVCCFSSYTNFTTYTRVISLLYSWTYVIDWGHSIFLFKVRQQEKDYCCLVA